MISRLLHHLRGARGALGDAGLSHPTDEELLCLVDGELPPREAARVQRHVDGCWNCRHRRTRMQQTIDAFMEACADDVAAEDAAPGAWRLPRAALAALHSTCGRASVDAAAPGLIDSPWRARARQPRQAWQAWRALAWTRVAAARLGSSRAVAVRVAAACATVWLIVLLSSGGPVSARQLARQIDRAERAALEQAVAPVVYQRLRITQQTRGVTGTRSASAGTWDIWTDVTQRRRLARRVDARAEGSAPSPRAPSRRQARTTSEALPLALATLLESSGAGDAWPVSLRAHQHWRAPRAAAQDTVGAAMTDAGEPALLLETRLDGKEADGDAAGGDRRAAAGVSDTTPDSASRIVRGALLVRERDWHPVEQRLTIRDAAGTDELIIRESGFGILPRASLPVAFFDADADHTARPAGTVADAPRAVVAPSATELVTAEVEAMYALHRVGLTAADDINLHRRARHIDIVGLTTTNERRRAMLAALAPIRLVRAKIQTADEALDALASAVGAATPRAAAIAETTAARPDELAPPLPIRFDAAEIRADRLPAQALGRADGSQAAPADRADAAALRRAREAVQQSLTLLERAWALRHLAEWSRRTQAKDVTAGTRALIDLMLRERTDAASKALATLDATLASALAPAFSEAAASPPADADAGANTGTPPASPATTAGPASAAARPDATDDARDWTDVAIDFFGAAAEIDRDTRRLFTATAGDAAPASVGNAAEDARRLRRGLDSAAHILDALRQTRP